MDKETIVGYLNDIDLNMQDGRFISAYKDLKFLIKQVDYDVKNDVPKQNSEEKLCPCGHEHKPRSDGRGLRTYCVEGSQCNSDKCEEFVSSEKHDG